MSCFFMEGDRLTVYLDDQMASDDVLLDLIRSVVFRQMDAPKVLENWYTVVKGFARVGAEMRLVELGLLNS